MTKSPTTLAAMVWVLGALGCVERPLGENAPDGAPAVETTRCLMVECGNAGQAPCEPSADNSYRYCCDGFTPYANGGDPGLTCRSCGGVGQLCCSGDVQSRCADSPDGQCHARCNAGLACVPGAFVNGIGITAGCEPIN